MWRAKVSKDRIWLDYMAERQRLYRIRNELREARNQHRRRTTLVYRAANAAYMRQYRKGRKLRA
jgi:hypothetical protein